MSEEEVLEARRLRKAARNVFETQRDLIKSDLGAAGVGKRVATRLASDGRMLAEEAADAANTHRPIVAAGALAVTAWLLRGPIMAFADRVLGREEGEEEEAFDTADTPQAPE
ncbi:hypothetical protein [Croceicoccus mobilis]|uniref:DUF3618 domain-containing protein n=1 Tax=Croceicoccus mobilis TaxID=1703339 RepID=A0A916YY60_9SPHN|nr:hypothetical protein [Croceicoccus mobilis]GGD66592.1 hypothetical protein GCM10010990_15180 [Croceicoccus mobilis]